MYVCCMCRGRQIENDCKYDSLPPPFLSQRMAEVWWPKSSVCLYVHKCVCVYMWSLMTQQGGTTHAEEPH